MSWSDALLAIAYPQGYNALQNYRENAMLNEDRAQLRNDLTQFAADPSYEVNLEKYNNPATAITVGEHLTKLRDAKYQKDAMPVVAEITAFQNDPRWRDKESSDIIAQDPLTAVFGNKVPVAGKNQYISNALNKFQTDTATQADVYNAMNGDRAAMARIAMQKDIPQQVHQATQGLEQLANVDKHAQEINTANKTAADLAQFQRTISGLNGGTTRPTDPELGPVYQQPVGTGQNGLTYVQTDTGNLMPFEELNARIQQAYADNPGVPREVVKNLMDDFRLQYEKSGYTSQGQVGRTKFQKWNPALGKPEITKEDVQPLPSRISINNAGKENDVRATVDRYVTRRDFNLFDGLTRNEKALALRILEKGQQDGTYPPDININQIKSNLAQETDPTLRRANARIDAALPLVDKYIKDVERYTAMLPGGENTQISLLPLNTLMAYGFKQIQDPALRKIEANRFYMIREANRAVANGVMAQTAIDEEMRLFSNANTIGEARVAGESLRNALLAAKEGNTNPPFPNAKQKTGGTAPSGGTWRLKNGH